MRWDEIKPGEVLACPVPRLEVAGEGLPVEHPHQVPDEVLS